MRAKPGGASGGAGRCCRGRFPVRFRNPRCKNQCGPLFLTLALPLSDGGLARETALVGAKQPGGAGFIPRHDEPLRFEPHALSDFRQSKKQLATSGRA
jgi:hypothetical protein